MFGIGWTEIVVVFILALLIFGPKRLPEIGRSLGKALGMFKEATQEMRRSMADMQSEIDAEIREARKAKEDLTRALLEDQTKPEPAEQEDPRSSQRDTRDDPDAGYPPDPPASGSSLAG